MEISSGGRLGSLHCIKVPQLSFAKKKNVCLSFYLSLCLCVRVCMCSACFCLFVCAPASLSASVRLLVCLSVCLFVCLSGCLFVCLSVRLLVWPPFLLPPNISPLFHPLTTGGYFRPVMVHSTTAFMLLNKGFTLEGKQLSPCLSYACVTTLLREKVFTKKEGGGGHWRGN